MASFFKLIYSLEMKPFLGMIHCSEKGIIPWYERNEGLQSTDYLKVTCFPFFALILSSVKIYTVVERFYIFVQNFLDRSSDLKAKASM